MLSMIFLRGFWMLEFAISFVLVGEAGMSVSSNSTYVKRQREVKPLLVESRREDTLG
jgi:hypothetical protein